jgi:LytS/YehU family sensor histidine kinase
MYFFFRRRQLTVKHEMLRLEQKLLRTQMNPHFIFNSLTTIGGFVINNRVQTSYNYITKFSKLIRLILESSRKEEIAIESELLIVENFLALHQMNKRDNLFYEIKYDESLLDEDIKVPPMLLQPFIENAIEHGGDFETGENFVSVEFKLKDNQLLLTVRDRGAGFNFKNKKTGQESYAIKITEERIQSIKKHLKKSIRLNIKDLNKDTEKEKGVFVEILVQI